MPRVTVKGILPVSNSADSSKEYLGAKPTPRSHNQMFDLPPGVRNYPPPCWIQSGGKVAWVITQGELQQEAGAEEMCTYAHGHMVIFVGDLWGKKKKKNLANLIWSCWSITT